VRYASLIGPLPKSNTEKLFTGSSLYELYRIAHNLEVERRERKDEGGVSKILKILKNP